MLYDLEITPSLAWVYDFYDANVVKLERESYIMCFSYNWYTEQGVHNVAQPDFARYREAPYDDSQVVRALWSLMDEADVVVAHNAKSFDNRVANARFMEWGLGPPSPYQTVDTLLAARRFFRFGQNSLSALCERLEIGSKPGHTHGMLWRDCVAGDMTAWEKMKVYNNMDVQLLGQLYDKLRPFITNHPNLATLMGGAEYTCPKCGGMHLQSRGFAYTATGTFRRYQCMDCMSWSRERLVEKGTRPQMVNAL